MLDAERVRRLIRAVASFHRQVRDRRQPAPLFAKVVAHECSGTCMTWYQDEFYICSLTGNMHICDAETCASQIQTPEHMVCSLTGRIFTLDLRPEWNARARTGVQKGGTCGAQRVKRKRAVADVRPSWCAKGITYAEVDVEETWNGILGVLGLDSGCEHARRALWFAEKLWRALGASTHVMKNGTKLTPVIVCVIVMSWTECGYDCSRGDAKFVIVPQITGLFDQLPGIIRIRAMIPGLQR